MPVSVGAVWPEALAADESLPDVAGLARVAEQAGLDGVWTGDRLIKDEMNVLDAGLVLAAAAAATERIAIGFSIYVPSLRSMAWAAREVASLQVLSAGRLQLGVALGGGPEREYQAVGLTGAHRARRTDDFLRLLPGLLGGEPVSLPDVPTGPVVRFRPAVPIPPVWVGGTAGAALRRAVRFGDGWLPGFLTAEEFAASARRLHELAAEAGRPRLRLGIAPRTPRSPPGPATIWPTSRPGWCTRPTAYRPTGPGSGSWPGRPRRWLTSSRRTCRPERTWSTSCATRSPRRSPGNCWPRCGSCSTRPNPEGSMGMSRVVVIGATGHIGTYLVPRLVRGGHEV